MRAYKQEYSCTEIQDNGSPVENVCVGGINTNSTIMGIYSRPSGQAEDTDEVFLHQMSTLLNRDAIIKIGELIILTSAGNLTLLRIKDSINSCPILLRTSFFKRLKKRIKNLLFWI